MRVYNSMRALGNASPDKVMYFKYRVSDGKGKKENGMYKGERPQGKDKFGKSTAVRQHRVWKHGQNKP